MSTDLPPPEPGERPVDPDGPDTETPGRRRMPNYTLRRAVAIGVVLVFFGVVIGAILVLFGGDDDDATDAATPGWDVVVEVDRGSGARTVLDRDGEIVADIDGVGRVTDVHVDRGRLVLVGADGLSIVGIEGDDRIEVELPRGWDVRRLPTHRAFTLVAGPSAPGPLVLVDGRTGEVLDVADLAGQDAPVLFPDSVVSDPDGTAFAVGDGANFQTVVVREGVEGVTFFPGVPMAVSDDLVVTSTNVGASAELGLFDAEGTRLDTVTSPRPVGGVLDDDRFVYATADGAILAAQVDDDEPVELGSAPVPGDDRVRSVVPTLNGQRLVLVGTRFVAVVDLDGDVVYQTTFTTDRSQHPIWSTWRCLPIGGADHGHAVIDLETGSTLADLSDGTIVGASADGCGVHLATDDGDLVVTPAGSSRVLDEARSLVLAPDATAVVIAGSDGRSALVPVTPDVDLGEDPDAEVVDLGVRRGIVVFAER